MKRPESRTRIFYRHINGLKGTACLLVMLGHYLGIYSFHWPIICSIGALSMAGLAGQIGLKKGYFITWFVVFIVTVLFSVGFYYTLERFAAWITKRIISRIRSAIR